MCKVAVDRGCALRSVGKSGQREKESGPFVHLALSPGPARMAFDNAPDVGQPEACPFKFFAAMQALEKAEELLGLAHVEAGSIVLDEKNELVVRIIQAADFNSRPLPVTSIFQGIANQVHPDLAEEGGVTPYRGQRSNDPIDLPLLLFGLQVIDDSAHDSVEIKFLSF